MKRRVWMWCGLFGVLAATAAAQGGAREEARAGEGAAKMVDAYLISNLQDGLGLNDEQYIKLLPIVQRHQRERRELFQRRLRALAELRQALHSGRATERTVADLLAEVKKVETEAPALQARNMQAIDALLTPLQQAKFRVMEAQVEHRVRELVRGVRQRNRGRGLAPRAQAPLEPEE